MTMMIIIIILHCTALHCTVLTVLYWTVLYCTTVLLLLSQILVV